VLAKELGKMTPYLRKKGCPWAKQRGGGDCLLKTQGPANSKEVVGGLTPARCWKVRWWAISRLPPEAPVNGGRNPDGPKVAKSLGS